MRCASKPASLSSRLLTTTAVVLALISGLVMLAIALLLRWGPQALIEADLERHAERVAEGLHFNAAGMPDGVKVDDKMEAVYDALRLDAVYRILDRDGTVLMASDRAATAYAPQGSAFDPMQARFDVQQDGKLLHVLTTPFTHDGRQFYVQIMRSERMHKMLLGSDSQKVRTIVLVCALVSMLLFSFVVVATLHHMLKPLRKASAAAAQIQPDNLSARLSLEGVPAELIPLFHAFNLALQRLDDGYRIQREFLATAAHELKTPLALIRGQIELEHADKGRDCSGLLRDLDHMTRQVHQLLHLRSQRTPELRDGTGRCQRHRCGSGGATRTSGATARRARCPCHQRESRHSRSRSRGPVRTDAQPHRECHPSRSRRQRRRGGRQRQESRRQGLRRGHTRRGHAALVQTLLARFASAR